MFKEEEEEEEGEKQSNFHGIAIFLSLLKIGSKIDCVY
jgi:hypothetical protein